LKRLTFPPKSSQSKDKEKLHRIKLLYRSRKTNLKAIFKIMWLLSNADLPQTSWYSVLHKLTSQSHSRLTKITNQITGTISTQLLMLFPHKSQTLSISSAKIIWLLRSIFFTLSRILADLCLQPHKKEDCLLPQSLL